MERGVLFPSLKPARADIACQKLRPFSRPKSFKIHFFPCIIRPVTSRPVSHEENT